MDQFKAFKGMTIAVLLGGLLWILILRGCL